MSMINEDLARDRAREILRDRLAATPQRHPAPRRLLRRRLFPR